MSTFTQYLAESSKSYDFKIKVAGQLPDDFASKMETALAKFEVAKMSAGKKTPIMTMPLDFPHLSNEEVGPRKTAILELSLKNQKLSVKNNSFYFVEKQ